MQLYVVHQIHNSIKYVGNKQQKKCVFGIVRNKQRPISCLVRSISVVELSFFGPRGTVEVAVTYGFGYVGYLDVGGAVEVGNGPGYL